MRASPRISVQWEGGRHLFPPSGQAMVSVSPSSLPANTCWGLKLYIFIPVYQCTCIYTSIHTYMYTGIPVYHYSNKAVQDYTSFPVQLSVASTYGTCGTGAIHLYTCAPMYPYTSIHVYWYTSIPGILYQYTSIPL